MDKEGHGRVPGRYGDFIMGKRHRENRSNLYDTNSFAFLLIFFKVGNKTFVQHVSQNSNYRYRSMRRIMKYFTIFQPPYDRDRKCTVFMLISTENNYQKPWLKIPCDHQIPGTSLYIVKNIMAIQDKKIMKGVREELSLLFKVHQNLWKQRTPQVQICLISMKFFREIN